MSTHDDEPTNEPIDHAAETSDMSSSSDTPDPTPEFRDPTADPMTDPITLPTTGTVPETTAIPPPSTQTLPASTPFRVEPATPVPDDAIAAGARLPHVAPPEAQPVPPVQQAQPAPQPAPRPALVTVNKGPRPATIMLGLLSVLMAAYVLVANLTDAHLSVRMIGPTMIGAFGGMLLLVGIAGVVAGRLRR
ncbi:hypothetical protein [Terrabacter carboxydivorans]|uniref:DUF1049 domain-containing protein n=1 Tax=Terrabacter carboxydivorans TaxID=619730 RepID=A0ABP5Y4G4_9MICO